MEGKYNRMNQIKIKYNEIKFHVRSDIALN
jgi:hypothetical protein